MQKNAFIYHIYQKKMLKPFSFASVRWLYSSVPVLGTQAQVWRSRVQTTVALLMDPTRDSSSSSISDESEEFLLNISDEDFDSIIEEDADEEAEVEAEEEAEEQPDDVELGVEEDILEGESEEEDDLWWMSLKIPEGSAYDKSSDLPVN